MHNKLRFFTLLFMAIVITGCSTPRPKPVKDANLVEVSYQSVDTLLKNLSKQIPPGSLVVVNSLVNADDLKQTSAFGRIVSEQISSAFNNAGYRIKGMELPTELFIQDENGILNLSEETVAALKKHNASALVGGVFAAGKRTVYISLRIADIASKNIISSTDYSVPMGPDAKALLKPKTKEESAEQIEYIQ